LHLILFLVGVSFFFSLLALGDVMSCVFEKELEWTRWNPTGRRRKEEKKRKRDSVVNGNIPNFYCQMLSAEQSSESSRRLFYFSFSVRGYNNNNNINTFFFVFVVH
jgi:hypothetical protein